MSYSTYLCIAVCIGFFIRWGYIFKLTNAELIIRFAACRRKISFDYFYKAYRISFIFMMLFSLLQITLFGFCLFWLVYEHASDAAGYICWAGIMLLFARIHLYYSIAVFVVMKGDHE